MGALEDFIIKRCEEILQNDEKSQKYNQKISELENQFKAKLTPELRKEYNKLEELTVEANTYNETLIYSKCCSKILNFLG